LPLLLLKPLIVLGYDELHHYSRGLSIIIAAIAFIIGIDKGAINTGGNLHIIIYFDTF